MDTTPFDISCYNHLNSRFQDIFEDDLINDICFHGRTSHIKANNTIIDIGDLIRYLPIIISGSVKILTEDNEGRELLLYYLEVGDTCAVTLNCCSGQTKSKIRAIAEEDTELLYIPTDKVEEWMGKYKSWRNFVLDMYNSRLNEILEAIDNLAFNNMEERIYKYLRDKAMVTGDTTIQTTHMQIANDLHSSRVVVSRLLKKLEMEGSIRSKRNAIELVKM